MLSNVSTYLHGRGEEEGADDGARVLAGGVHHRPLEEEERAGAAPVAAHLRLLMRRSPVKVTHQAPSRSAH